MITLTMGDVWTHVRSDEPTAHTYIKDALRGRPEGYRYTRAFKRGVWDGYTTLYDTRTQRFPTGLRYLVHTALTTAGWQPEEIRLVPAWTKGVAGTVTPSYLSGVTLRPYQVAAANALLDEGRGVLKAATNAGKTEIIAACIKAVEAPALVIVHKKELMYQTVERLRTRLAPNWHPEEIGMLGDGVADIQDVTVAMIQTLARHRDAIPANFGSNQLLFLDECHHASAAQTFDCVVDIPGTFRFGCSGTPLKYDVLSDLKLVGATGDVVYEVSNRDLIDLGVSATPQVTMLSVDTPQLTRGLAWHDAYRAGVVEHDARNATCATLVRACLERGLPTLCLVNELDHGERIRRAVGLGRDSVVFVSGDDSTATRQGVIARLRAGGAFCAIATDIFGEGVDVPAVGAVVLAAGGKSHIQLLQRVGRGLRSKATGENVLYVFDFYDNTCPTLAEHSLRRRVIYQREGFALRTLPLREATNALPGL